MSVAKGYLDERTWFEPESGFEYRADPLHGTWHRISPREGQYQDIDAV